MAEKSGKLHIGDELLSINGESVLNKPLSEAIKLLQQSGTRVQLQLSRKMTGEKKIVLLYDKCLLNPDPTPPFSVSETS